MHPCECIMFQHKMNIFEAGTYFLLSIEFSAYRIEIHLQECRTFACKSLWNTIYWILMDLWWQRWSREGSEGGRGCRGTSKDFVAEMKSTKLNKSHTVQSRPCFGFRFHAKVYYVLRLSQCTWAWLCSPLFSSTKFHFDY